MPKVKRAELAADAHRRNLEQVAGLGGELKTARQRRRLTQEQLAALAGISRPAESRIERGMGAGHTLDTWQRLALAAGRPLILRLQRDPLEDTLDAGHLAMQGLVLRLGRRAGFAGSFELATRSTEPWRSTDVGLRDDRRRVIALFECWNSMGDIGAAARSTTRKVQEADAFATAVWGDQPHQVASCWGVRATARNRELIRRYPEVFRSRFPGSSVAWVRVLSGSVVGLRRALTLPAVPEDAGLIWCDVAATKMFAWRHGVTGRE
jgi:transcriptional regulator with XRE-family HTH domain